MVARGASDDTRIYYRFFRKTVVSSKHLAVVVRLLEEEGFILTAYFTERIRREKVVWRRRASS